MALKGGLMAEKVAEMKVQIGSSGARFVTIPQSYADDMGLVRGSVVEVFRKGDTLVIRPKKDEKGPRG